MAKSKFYKVHTLPGNATTKPGILNRLTKNRKRKQLIASVVGVYILVGGMVGWVLFNNNHTSPAKASDSALISASIKLSEEREYKLGDSIKIGMTLQNTSVSESINNVSLDLFTTKDSIKWTTIKSGNTIATSYTITPTGSASIPLLAAGERMEFEIQGNVQNNQLEYTNIQAKIKYNNQDGLQNTETNRVRLNTQISKSTNLFNLKSDKLVYGQNEEMALSLQKDPSQAESKGKIYISNKKTQELANSVECELTGANICESKIKSLPIGEYSALYIDENENVFSNILQFNVNGKQSDFKPGNQSSLELPIGNASINGILPVLAKKVISLNQTPNIDTVCAFEVYSGDNLVDTVKATVDTDRTCKATLNAENFKNGDGIYKIKLGNTEIVKEVAYLNKTANLIDLQNKSTILENGKSVQLEARNILELSAPDLIKDKKVTLGIYHTATSEYNEVSKIDGETLKVVDGNFNAIITPNYLNKGGFYLIFMKVEDGQQSDWISLDFADKQIAFSGTGILFDPNTLKVGQNVNFSMENLVDRNGNQVDEGDCSANIYASGVQTAVNIKGQIKKGICNAALPAGKIVKAGPALISFTANDIVNKINQSKQINISAGNADKFGALSLEVPAKADFANTLYIGPVTDKFGNLTDAYNYKLNLESENEVLTQIPVQIQKGFAKIQIASTYFKDESLVAKLTTDKDVEVLNTTFNIDQTNSKYIDATLPSEVTNDKNITASIEGLDLTNQIECKLSLIKSQTEVSQSTAVFDNTTKKCNFDWDLNENRSADQALIQLSIGDKVFTKITTLKSSEATNLFVITPQIRITNISELSTTLLTAPIVDKQGKPVEKGALKWQYNGKVVQTEIENGLSKLEIPASKLEVKDIQVNTTARNLELDLDVKAGITSISKTNNLSIYIGNYDISNAGSNFVDLSSSTQITQNQDRIFQFKSDICKGKLISSLNTTTALKTHSQGGICYVQTEGKPGTNTISFEDLGFTLGSYKFETTLDPQDINWCQTSTNSDKCMIQVVAPINSSVEAIIKDGDQEYKFTSSELDNTVILSQNGLNPLKKYSVEVRYKDSKNVLVTQTRQILGEKLTK